LDVALEVFQARFLVFLVYSDPVCLMVSAVPVPAACFQVSYYLRVCHVCHYLALEPALKAAAEVSEVLSQASVAYCPASEVVASGPAVLHFAKLGRYE
jgi:hypothetical protein